MLHCYKIEFNFPQKKFNKHLLHNIIVVYADIVKQNVSRVLLLEWFKVLEYLQKTKTLKMTFFLLRVLLLD